MLLAAAVISVPIARFLRLSAIVAYLVAGVVIGPFGFGIFNTPERILTVAELGVVMLLFLIGLELELSRLLAMRRAIFGLGVAQLVLTAAAIAGLAIATGMFNWGAALVATVVSVLCFVAAVFSWFRGRGTGQAPVQRPLLEETEEGLAGLVQAIADWLVPEPPPAGAAVPFTEALCGAVEAAARHAAEGDAVQALAELRG